MTPGGTCESALMPRSTFFHMLNQSVNDDHVFHPLYFGPTLILQSLNEGVMLLISETFPSFSAARCVPLSLSIVSYLRAQLTLACWGKARPPPDQASLWHARCSHVALWLRNMCKLTNELFHCYEWNMKSKMCFISHIYKWTVQVKWPWS